MLSAHKTMMLVSHDLDSVKDMCSHVLWLEHGRLIASGPVEEVLKEYTAKYAAKKG